MGSSQETRPISPGRDEMRWLSDLQEPCSGLVAACHDADKQMPSRTKLQTRPSWYLEAASSPLSRHSLRDRLAFFGQILPFLIIIVQFIMLYRSYALLAACGLADAGLIKKAASSSSTSVADYFQTKPELFPGPTPTGPAPFLAQTNPAPFASTTYIPNSPLETQVPIKGNTDNGNIVSSTCIDLCESI